MWICANDGFVSAVQHRNDPDMLMVRARDEQHLFNLFPGREDQVYSVDGSDYGYRIEVSKEYFAEIISERIEDIDYSNFKNSVIDKKLHSFYERVWYVGLQILGGPSAYSHWFKR